MDRRGVSLRRSSAVPGSDTCSSTSLTCFKLTSSSWARPTSNSSKSSTCRVPMLSTLLTTSPALSPSSNSATKTQISHDAARLVKRFRARWSNTGHRPAGICGACLLLAERMNNFRRSVQEPIQVVKVTKQTALKRLDEFKHTGSAVLTVTQFRDRTYWQPEAVEAPAIIKDQEKRRRGC